MSRLPLLMQPKLVLSAYCTSMFLFQACLNFSSFQIRGSRTPRTPSCYTRGSLHDILSIFSITIFKCFYSVPVRFLYCLCLTLIIMYNIANIKFYDRRLRHRDHHHHHHHHHHYYHVAALHNYCLIVLQRSRVLHSCFEWSLQKKPVSAHWSTSRVQLVRSWKLGMN